MSRRCVRRPRRYSTPDGTGAVEQPPGRPGRASSRVRFEPVEHRVEVRPGGAQPPTASHVLVEGGEPLLAVPVDVVGAAEPRLLARRRARPRRAPMSAGPRSSSSGPSPPRHSSTPARQVSIRLKYGQAVGVRPVGHAGSLRPLLVVGRIAALEDHPVDRRRPTEHLAPGVVARADRPCAARVRTRTSSRRSGCRSGRSAPPACG